MPSREGQVGAMGDAEHRWSLHRGGCWESLIPSHHTDFVPALLRTPQPPRSPLLLAKHWLKFPTCAQPKYPLSARLLWEKALSRYGKPGHLFQEPMGCTQMGTGALLAVAACDVPGAGGHAAPPSAPRLRLASGKVPSAAQGCCCCGRARAGRRAEPREAPDAKRFDSQKSNYRAADYRANKIPLRHFGK